MEMTEASLTLLTINFIFMFVALFIFFQLRFDVVFNSWRHLLNKLIWKKLHLKNPPQLNLKELLHPGQILKYHRTTKEKYENNGKRAIEGDNKEIIFNMANVSKEFSKIKIFWKSVGFYDFMIL